MGAMKAYAMDVTDLHDYAQDGEEALGEWVEEAGWMSPTEQLQRKHFAAEAVKELPADQQAAVIAVLAKLGIELPALNFPIRGSVPDTSQRAA